MNVDSIGGVVEVFSLPSDNQLVYAHPRFEATSKLFCISHR
jgi:hypothetical protein